MHALRLRRKETILNGQLINWQQVVLSLTINLTINIKS